MFVGLVALSAAQQASADYPLYDCETDPVTTTLSSTVPGTPHGTPLPIDEVPEVVSGRKFIDPTRTYMSCIDGRQDTQHVVATPGGDMGEVLLFTNVYQTRTGLLRQYWNVRALLLTLVTGLTRPLYLHTDSTATARFLAATGATNINAVPVAIQGDAAMGTGAFGQLTNSSHIGCGHIKGLIVNPTAYGVNGTIMAWTYRAYFDILWNYKIPSRLLLAQTVVTVPGPHSEESILAISSSRTGVDDTNPCKGLEPAVIPSNAGLMNFILSPGAITLFRQQMGTFYARVETLNAPQPALESDYINSVNALSDRGNTVSLNALAAGLPLYAVDIPLARALPAFTAVATRRVSIGCLADCLASAWTSTVAGINAAATVGCFACTRDSTSRAVEGELIVSCPTCTTQQLVAIAAAINVTTTPGPICYLNASYAFVCSSGAPAPVAPVATTGGKASKKGLLGLLGLLGIIPAVLCLVLLCACLGRRKRRGAEVQFAHPVVPAVPPMPPMVAPPQVVVGQHSFVPVPMPLPAMPQPSMFTYDVTA